MSSRWKATILFHYWCTRRRIGHVVKRKGKLILPPEFDEKKIVFFHVPKTAGKSLATAIYDKDINHFSYNQVAKQKDLDGFFTFSFVRNPWDRIVSTYEFLKGGGWGGLDQIWLDSRRPHLENFSVFLRYVERKPHERVHFLPQTYWICDSENNIKVDFLGKFENLSEDYNKL